MTLTLNCDIYERKVLVGKAGEQVTLIGDYVNVLVVQNKEGKKVFSKNGGCKAMKYLNDNDPEVLWGSAIRDAEAFMKGAFAKDEETNPYKPNTNKWYSWNAGKNMRD